MSARPVVVGRLSPSDDLAIGVIGPRLYWIIRDKKYSLDDAIKKKLKMNLAEQKCVPCSGRVPPVERARAKALLRELGDGWQLNGDGHLDRTYTFSNFHQAMTFANKVADIADVEGHHPDLYIAWGQCRVEIWTHKISGLTESDFFFAAKADRALNELPA